MASPATATQSNGTTKAPAAAPVLIPFTRAAKEHEEPFVDQTYVFDGNTHQQGPFDVVAYGYMRYIKLLITATGGTGAAAVAQPDAPFIVLSEVALQDVNGANIIGPFTGFDLYLINKYGGLRRGLPDPKSKFSYQGVQTSGNFQFSVRIPVEICNRDALGSLANQNSSSTFKLKFTTNANTNVYSTLPTTVPSVRVRAWLEAWTQPAAADLRGHPQATLPPAHGTTQYWTKTQININAGTQTQRLPRVGNYIRNLIFIYRSATGVRSTMVGQWPDPIQLNWDTRLLNSFGVLNLQDEMAERRGFTGTIETSANALDNSVYTIDFCHEFDGQVGEELRDGWLPTLQSTRLDVYGTFGAAGTLEILTNDVSPTGEVFV